MNVSLTPELERFVQRKVKTGRYTSASEVVREALRLLEEQDQTRGIRRKIDLGWASFERGQTVEASDVFARLERREKQLEPKAQ